MNNTKIDYCTKSWNPVTGCYHNCEYCYARKIAKRFADPYVVGYDGTYVLSDKASQYIENPQLQDGHILLAQKNPIFKNIGLLKPNGKSYSAYPFGFCPTFHCQRLYDPSHVKKPQTIFVCSMADLFGDWVPDEWIQKVFDACQNAPWHRYLFLTKNPKRYNEIRTNRTRGISISRDLRNRVWLGATATTQEQLYFAASALEDADQTVFTFLSIEPIFEPVSVYEIDCFANWVIIGAETGNRKNKPVVCKWWIDDIVKQCKDMNVPIFMKESLRTLMGADFKQEFPWGG